jgi:putative nucleotidyltransferase with HDIG domain
MGLKDKFLTPINRKILKVGILIMTCAASFFALILPIAQRASTYALSPGDVATQDILAPNSLSYTSQILTDQARLEAEQKVGAIYLPADSAISRRQIERLRSALTFISVTRYDTFATSPQKFTDLSNLSDLQLRKEDVDIILFLNESRWEGIQKEALGVLEQIMRETIRDDQLRDAQRRVPTLISFSFPDDEAGIITKLITPFVIPNSLFSQEQTKTAKDEASRSIEPINKTFVAGEIIVRRGQVITPLTWEALQQFGLIRPQNNLNEFLAAILMCLLMGTLTAIYFERKNRLINDNLKGLVLISLNFILFLFASRLVIPNHTIIPYLFPLQSFGLMVACLFSPELAFFLSIILSILTAYGLPNSLDLTIYYLISSLVGILVMGRATRFSSFFWAGIATGLTGGVTILTYRMLTLTTDFFGVATLMATALLAGIASASLTLLLQFLYAQLLGVTTALQLLEISRPDHPLLQFILQNAPGSYQHSLQVAILAEQAAEKINADSLLVRVGCLYHDAGKANNPAFFIENQVEKINPHDDLDPAVSAQTIIQHVADSVALAKKHHIPPRIQDFMREHHGTMITRYQYARALQNAGNDKNMVDESMFRYPGPIPGSRETALLMLADGTQARTRAELPNSEEELRTIVLKTIDFCQKEGQLNDTRLTLRDLSIITESFVQTLKNTYHPRIRYPEIPSQDKNKPPENGDVK